MTMGMYIDKIAIPSTGENAECLISKNFGRCPFIIIYDGKRKGYDAYENTGAKLRDGSGLKAAEIVIQNKANVLLTIEIGRKAYSILSEEHVDIRLLKSTGTVKSAVNKFIKKINT